MNFFGYVFGSTVGLLFACCQGSSFEKNNNAPVTELVSVQHTINNACFRYPFRVRLSNDTLYVMDLHGSDTYVQAFLFPKMEWVASYGKKGGGPKELLDCENIRIDAQGHLWMLDANKRALVCVSDSGERKIELSHSLIRTLDFDFYTDSLFIVPDYTGKYRYSLIDCKGNIVSSRGKIPINAKREADVALAQAWRSFSSYNPKNGILAMVTQLGEVIELYNVKQDTLITTIYGKLGAPVYSKNNNMAIPKGIMGYSDVQVGSHCIYALFWGQSLKDIERGVVTYEGGNRIDVFDLKGNILKTYRLDRYITGFQVDESKQFLIALDPNSDQPLVCYNLNET